MPLDALTDDATVLFVEPSRDDQFQVATLQTFYQLYAVQNYNVYLINQDYEGFFDLSVIYGEGLYQLNLPMETNLIEQGVTYGSELQVSENMARSLEIVKLICSFSALFELLSKYYDQYPDQILTLAKHIKSRIEELEEDFPQSHSDIIVTMQTRTVDLVAYSGQILQVMQSVIVFLSQFLGQYSGDRTMQMEFLEFMVRPKTAFGFYAYSYIHRLFLEKNLGHLADLVFDYCIQLIELLTEEEHHSLLLMSSIFGSSDLFVSPLDHLLDASSRKLGRLEQYQHLRNKLHSVNHPFVMSYLDRLEYKVITTGDASISFIKLASLSDGLWKQFRTYLEDDQFYVLLSLQELQGQTFQELIATYIQDTTNSPRLRLLAVMIYVRLHLYLAREFDEILQILLSHQSLFNELSDSDHLFLLYLSAISSSNTLHLVADQTSWYQYYATIAFMNQKSPAQYEDIADMYHLAIQSADMYGDSGIDNYPILMRTKANYAFFCLSNDRLQEAIEHIHEILDYYQTYLSKESFTYAHGFAKLLIKSNHYPLAEEICRWFSTVVDETWQPWVYYYQLLCKYSLTEGRDQHSAVNYLYEFINYHVETYDTIQQGGMVPVAYFGLIASTIAYQERDEQMLHTIYNRVVSIGKNYNFPDPLNLLTYAISIIKVQCDGLRNVQNIEESLKFYYIMLDREELPLYFKHVVVYNAMYNITIADTDDVNLISSLLCKIYDLFDDDELHIIQVFCKLLWYHYLGETDQAISPIGDIDIRFSSSHGIHFSDTISSGRIDRNEMLALMHKIKFQHLDTMKIKV